MEAIDTQSTGGDGTTGGEAASAPGGESVLRRRTLQTDATGTAATALLQFFRTGTLPPDAGAENGLSGHVPALLFPFLSRPGLRTPWPLVLDGGEEPDLRPLAAFVEAVAEAVSVPGDEGELRKRFLARVEEAIRLTDLPDEANLEETWWAAADSVRPGIRTDRRDAFEDAMRAVSAHLSGTARLLGCGTGAPVVIARAYATEVVEEVSTPVVREAGRLRIAIQNLLDVEREESLEAVLPERLRGSAGGAYADAFDFEALSHLLEEAPHAATLSPERRERMAALAQNLDSHVSALYGDVPRVLRPVSHRSAREAVSERVERLLALYRDLDAARLEAAHRYRPEIHDGVLGSLSAAMLSPEDLRRCPPLIVHADEESLDAAGAGHLLELLSGSFPVKVILVLRGSPDHPASPSMAAALPSAAVGLGRAFVVQAALSDTGTLARGIRAAVRHEGPALVAVRAGSSGSSLPDYFAAAVARDGRDSPSFLCRPASDGPWADRLDVTGNESPESDWVGGSVEVTLEDGSRESLDSAFTWIDFAATCPSLSGHFVVVDRDADEGTMIPAAEYLALADAERSGAVPYIRLATPDGFLVRAVPSRPLVRSAEMALRRWHRLRELGGIGNSFAERAIAEASDRLEAERDEAIARAEATHAEELDRAISSVAEAIVSNIAASLLDLPTGAAPPAIRTAPLARPVPAAEEVPAQDAAERPAPAVEEEPEEALSLDEAYIETVRCTSCNECTNLNGQIFAYNDEKQAFIKNAAAGPYRDLVTAAEKCPVRIIHPGKPLDPDEPGLDDLLERAKPFL